MEKTMRFFLLFCLVPFILLLVQIGLDFVPVEQHVSYDGNTLHIYFGNWITDLGIDSWLSFIFGFSITFQGLFAIGLLLKSRRKTNEPEVSPG
jgi:hypothetical protein